MNAYKLLIEYDGTNLHGWQRQPSVLTVQQAIEDAIAVATGEKSTVVGSGRTDAGVHARGQVAHFCLTNPADEWKLRGALNGLLPRSVRILEIVPVPPDFHARYDAIRRDYQYHLSVQPRALDAATRWIVRGQPDFESMNDGANKLLGCHDFSAFCRARSETPNRICTVFEAGWKQESRDGDWRFSIGANRFLHGMVRTIVGTLMDIGYGKMSPPEIQNILESKDRKRAGQAAPARGLVLQHVTYPSYD